MSIPYFYYDETYTDAVSEDSRFPKERYRLVRRELEARGLLGYRMRLERPRRATRRELELVHEADYVEAFLEGELSDDRVRRIGFRPWTETFVERTLRLTGGTIEAYERLADGDRLAGNLAGGTHHAFADAGAGYCVFNDLAICAHRARRESVAERVAIVDLDVHQGDGTARLFADEPTVATFSMHCADNFPFRKQTSDCDVSVPEGTGDDAYLERLEAMLPAFLDRHDPDLVLFQAGTDGLAEDRHGRLDLTLEGLRRRNRRVCRWLVDLEVPLLVTMGGGYAEPIERSVRAHADLFEGLLRHYHDAR
jgi:acetoin utilization deacetylase AcuC-like enzyme